LAAGLGPSIAALCRPGLIATHGRANKVGPTMSGNPDRLFLDLLLDLPGAKKNALYKQYTPDQIQREAKGN
jgi:hypothetical protein